MLATQRGPGSPAALSLSSTLSTSARRRCVTQTLPSSVPAHSTSAFRGLSAMAEIVPFLEAVRSGLIAFRLSPLLTERKTYCAPE